jgi:hypothetical protein
MRGIMNTHFRSKERGAAVVEFAVVLPILLAFLFGIIEFGRVMSVCHTLNNAARAGARIAALPGADNSSVTNAINAELSGCGLTADSLVFDPVDISTADRDDPITVTVRVNYESIGLVTGYFPMFNGKQLVGTVVMRKEGFT